MVNSVGKGYSEADRAYIAGIFDGDGAIMACIEPHKEKRFRFRVRINLKVTQNNLDLLQWLRSLSGFGHIRKNRTTFDWNVHDQKHCKELLNLFGPYSRVKAKQVKIALRILNTKIDSKRDLIRVARLADTLSGFNVRSLGRRKNYVSKIYEYSSSND